MCGSDSAQRSIGSASRSELCRWRCFHTHSRKLPIPILRPMKSAKLYSMISDSGSNIKQPATLSTLVISIVLIPVFIYWVGRQERLGRPAIIPNSLWRNRVFTTICIGVFITWGVFNAVETLLTLFFQDVQEISAIQTSIRFLPEPIVGALANIVMGLLVHKIRAYWAVIIAIAISAISALLMSIIQPEWQVVPTKHVCLLYRAVFISLKQDQVSHVHSVTITDFASAGRTGLVLSRLSCSFQLALTPCSPCRI